MAELCPSPKMPNGECGKCGPVVPTCVLEASEPGNVAAPQQKAGPTPPPVLGLQWTIRTATLSPAKVSSCIQVLLQSYNINVRFALQWEEPGRAGPLGPSALPAVGVGTTSGLEPAATHHPQTGETFASACIQRKLSAIPMPVKVCRNIRRGQRRLCAVVVI